MDRNTLIAFLLIGLILIVFQVMNQPPPPEPGTESQETTETTNVEVVESPPPAPEEITPKQLSDQFIQTEKSEVLTTLVNEDLSVKLSNKGGKISFAELAGFKTAAGGPLILMDDDRNEWSYQFFINNLPFSTGDFYFDLEEQTGRSATYRLYIDSTKTAYVEQSYTLADTGYDVDYQFKLVGFESRLANRAEINLNWTNYLKLLEKDVENEQYKTGFYYKGKDDNVDYLSETSDDDDRLNFSVDWVACKQQFFNQTIIAEKAFSGAVLESKVPINPKDSTIEMLSAQMIFPYEPASEFSFPMTVYLGPNKYSLLAEKDIQLENVVYLGWAIFKWVNKGVIIPLFNFLNRFFSNYGVIIIVLTLIIKLILFPLTYRSYLSMAKMSALKPEIEELKARHGEDMQKMQQEQMKLYSKAGVNPLGGCLPQMLQLPILIAMYNFFPSALELRQESFLWATDLSTYDSILNLPFHIPIYGAHVSLFTLLAAGASLLMTQFNSQLSAQSNAQMKMIQYIMPLFLIFIFNSFSAALTFYFFLSSIITFLQQIVIKRFFIDEEKIRRQINENKKKPKKQSKFQRKLEEMMRAQQEQQKQRQRGRSKSGKRK